MHRFYIGKKYLPCWSVGKKISFQGEIFQPPLPLKSQMVRPLLSNCISYCTESARNEYKYPTILYSWLL